MNGAQTQIAAEIASLQRRAEQLTASSLSTARVLAALIAEAEHARSTDDAIGVRRLDRKIHLVRQRDTKTTREMHMLEELIAARRARYGLALTPASPVQP